MDNIVLALDASTKATGWAIYKGKELTAHGVITAGSNNKWKRIEKMSTEIEKLIEEYSVSEVIIEEILLEDIHHNYNVFKALMYLQGEICHMLDKHKMVPEFVEASHWRKCCGIQTGRGVVRTSLKTMDIAFVRKQFGLNVSDDEADAIGIGFSKTNPPLKVEKNVVQKDEFGFEFG